MLHNYNLLIVILVVIVLGLFIFTLYYFNKKKTSNTIVNSNNQLNYQFLKSNAPAGAIVPYGNAVPNNDYIPYEPTTVVELTDAELNELLQIVFAEIGNSNIIEVQLLQSLGMYTDTIVTVLQALGYIIN
jgi:hypothetical protein